ncbi:hypothetical protein NP233_g1836 [Leucocoprinus birnbaumii]|uniref:Nephrocystin 3-like N-terminal domain-containing protein n=1 Tax=Leucocoprinus birnbaumii TaxID=56174 RepID=A0AAD5W1F1_9AGAR|nr:hypothetical protein NP233_g1836 [Leucocoprinus birnbaumii]
MFSRIETVILCFVVWAWLRRTNHTENRLNAPITQEQSTGHETPSLHPKSSSSEITKNRKSRSRNFKSSKATLHNSSPRGGAQPSTLAAPGYNPLANHDISPPMSATATATNVSVDDTVLGLSQRERILQGSANQDHEMFQVDAHDFIINNPVMIDTTNDDFLKEFALHTLRGAELDSSARDPPPRCHPGTRLKIIERMRARLHDPIKRAQWLVGPAGVGKSAIMQTVAELEQQASSLLATLFFSAPNGRNDPSRVMATLASQIARQHEGYRRYIRAKIRVDPHLWDKSIKTQFNDLIVEPFAVGQVYRGKTAIFIFIDGLDECKGQQEQLHLLDLIFTSTIKYPEAPFLWVIASRPELHIKNFFETHPFSDQLEVSIDSAEACQDVERFVRSEFQQIRQQNPLVKSLYKEWPPEYLLLQFLSTILGLFAYAETAMRYIADMTASDPISRFKTIMDLINNASSPQTSDEAQPTARLDTLYHYILSQTSPKHLPHVEEILAFVIFARDVQFSLTEKSFGFMCDWLGMPPHVAYAALSQLHSTIYVPHPRDATRDDKQIRIYHKSFSEFLLDKRRSGIAIGSSSDEHHRSRSRAVRILRDIPYLRSPGHQAHKNIALSCLYQIGFAADYSQRGLYFSASWEVHHMSSLPANLSLPEIAHILKVSQFDPRDDYGAMSEQSLRLLFGSNNAKLTKLLRDEGALQDIPLGLLDREYIRQNDKLVFGIADTKRTPGPGYPDFKLRPDFRVSVNTTFSEFHSTFREKLLSHLECASSRELARVFIGTEFTGIIKFINPIIPDALPGSQIHYLMYDFKTIRQRLEK